MGTTLEILTADLSDRSLMVEHGVQILTTHTNPNSKYPLAELFMH